MRTRYRLPSGQSLDSVVAALEDQLGKSASSGESLRLTWWDTFDWRLWSAGLVLVAEQPRRGSGILRLEERDSGLLLARSPRGTAPAFAHELPPGPLLSRLGPICGPRRLIALPALEVERRRLDLTDHREKTLATIHLEEATTEGGEALDAGVELIVLRGFEREARSVRSWLDKKSGLGKDAGTRLARLAEEAGREPGVDPSSHPVDLDPAAASGPAVRALLAAQVSTMESNREGVLKDWDPEFLHDWRVAVRRTRSLITEMGDTLPETDRLEGKALFGELGRASSPLRDLDVWLETLPIYRSQLPPDLRHGLDPLESLLRAKQRTTQRAFAKLLRTAALRARIKQWTQLCRAEGDSEAPQTRPGKKAIGKRARLKIDKLLSRVLDEGGAITRSSPPEAMHDLRKRAKRLRYALEFFGKTIDAARTKVAIKALKKLQDNLGDFQDLEIQRNSLKAAGEELASSAPPTTLMAIGVLMEDMDRRQAGARKEFARVFKQFQRSDAIGELRRILAGKGAKE